MKKIIALALVAVSLAATLTACGSKAKTGNCEMCGAENVAVKTLTYDGESADFCVENCYESAKAIIEMAKSLG